jgi:RNAse (barnase) inhibitor barstar
MKRIILDATQWSSESEFHEAVVTALGAPDWHGRNLDAWWDSIVHDFNDVHPPYLVVIDGLETCGPDLQGYIERFIELFAEARRKFSLEVYATATPLN